MQKNAPVIRVFELIFISSENLLLKQVSLVLSGLPISHHTIISRNFHTDLLAVVLLHRLVVVVFVESVGE